MDLAAFAAEQLQAMNINFSAGMKVGREISRVAHQALKAAYADALKDESVRIPSPLHCAIENILRLREEQATNDYVNDAIKRDKEVPQWERELRTGAKDIPVGS